MPINWVAVAMIMPMIMHKQTILADDSPGFEIIPLINSTTFIEVLGEAAMATDYWTIFANVTIESHENSIKYLQQITDTVTSL